MTVRELLDQCRTALTEITAIERQIDRLMSTGAPSDGSGGGIRREKVKKKSKEAPEEYVSIRGTNNPEAARSQAVDGCEAVLKQKQQRLNEMMAEMERIIEKLSDGKARTIIRYYYGVGWSDERIADELETSREVITRRRNAAVDWLESQKVTESHTAYVVK